MADQIDLNSTACIHEQIAWGVDRIVNICTNAQTEIPWTGMDYIGWSILMLTMIAIILGILWVMFAIVYYLILDN